MNYFKSLLDEYRKNGWYDNYSEKHADASKEMEEFRRKMKEYFEKPTTNFKYTIVPKSEIMCVQIPPETMKQYAMEPISRLSLLFSGLNPNQPRITRLTTTKTVTYDENDVWFRPEANRFPYWGFYLPENDSGYTGIIVSEYLVKAD